MNARFAVKGIHSSSSDGSVVVAPGDGARVSVAICGVSVTLRECVRTVRALRSIWRSISEWGRRHADERRARALEEVQRKLSEIQRRKRGRVRWQISKHTAEMAIDAIEVREKRASRNSKSRRRKRTKRML